MGRINSNKFNNSGDYGIKCTQNTNGLATHVLDIKFNSMNDSTSLNSIYGIAVQNTVITNSARLTIESNSIKKIQRAIWVTNMQNKAQVIKHNVNYSAISAASGITFSNGTATTTNPNFGITVENCKGIHVKENDVTKQGANPSSTFSNTSYGITSSLSASSVISNNTIHKLGRGLISLGTPNAAVVTCNYLDKNFYGLVLDNTNIVNQGSTTLAQDNQWSAAAVITAKTVYSANSTIPIFYTRNSTAQFKPIPASMVLSLPAAIDFQLTLPNPTYNCLFGCASPPCINPNLARIVKREPPFDLLPAEEQLIADFSTLQMIKENDSLIQFGQPEANTLIAFKDSLLNTNTGLLQTFVEKMDLGDSLLAKQALMAVVPSYSPEENAKIVDEVYYRTWAKDLFELSREDSARLLQVAQQWPVKGGTAVFDARVMIGYWQNDHFVDNSNARLANNLSEGEETIIDNYGVLYPNPAQNIINYDITLEEGENGLLMIYDVTGKLINTQKIIEGESKSIIDCEKWNNGIYFYRLLINGETKTSKSFMISK
ncbi:MAG: T9SS type A sorting domain-containing protein [Bacteroidetes bacterium]|nr:T9SS type A sorting domain-containing protein [Bacteroidota bacterium]